ncbi:hypothetical protein RRSWK_02288 [Rhodopirellula sp. SWK7]|nr:hypothetical protein RRSWK_02288 [Rhodopirellula sp. SWK7]
MVRPRETAITAWPASWCAVEINSLRWVIDSVPSVSEGGSPSLIGEDSDWGSVMVSIIEPDRNILRYGWILSFIEFPMTHRTEVRSY